MRRFLSLVTEDLIESQYTIISATKDYVIDIVNLRKELSKESSFVNANTVEQEKRNIPESDSKNSFYQLVLFNKRPIGFCISFHLEKIDLPNEVIIGLIAVLNKHSGKGLATKLIQNVCQWAKEKDCNYVNLNVDSKNQSARRLYKALSFNDIDKFCYYQMQKKV